MIKKTIARLFSVALLATAFQACSPDDPVYNDNSVMAVSDIDHIELIANQKMVIADGKAQIELYPRLFTKDNNQIPDSRVREEWLEYVSDSGEQLSRLYSTSNSSLVGRTITARLKIKGTELVSNPVSFEVIAPRASEMSSEIKIPVVFHIVQKTEDVESFGGAYKQEQIAQVLKKLNYMLSGEITNNPVGVDTHIRLALALYNPEGERMMEPGIDRTVITDIDQTNSYQDFLNAKHLVWPVDKYLNIWLISDRMGESSTFNGYSNRCVPRYTTATADIPEGLEVTAYAGEELGVFDSGIMYKLQELDNIDRSFRISSRESGYNDLSYFFGRYLGLLPTCNYASDEIGNDYCDDTLNYFRDSNVSGSNENIYKESEGCYFLAENVMDDPTGRHCSVSQQQALRMRWALNNCVGRQAWKSNFAFEGR